MTSAMFLANKTSLVASRHSPHRGKQEWLEILLRKVIFALRFTGRHILKNASIFKSSAWASSPMVLLKTCLKANYTAFSDFTY